ncbi:hypothetical protein MTO96_035660, partial [Rhipicephalus appendiculatus]
TKVPIPSELPDEDDEDTLGSAILACIMCILFSLLVAYLLFYVFITETRYERSKYVLSLHFT